MATTPISVHDSTLRNRSGRSMAPWIGKARGGMPKQKLAIPKNLAKPSKSRGHRPRGVAGTVALFSQARVVIPWKKRTMKEARRARMPTAEVRERKETDLTQQKGKTMAAQIKVLMRVLSCGWPSNLDTRQTQHEVRQMVVHTA